MKFDDIVKYDFKMGDLIIDGADEFVFDDISFGIIIKINNDDYLKYHSAKILWESGWCEKERSLKFIRRFK